MTVDQVSPGDVAQLARAPALQAGGHGLESRHLHGVVEITTFSLAEGCFWHPFATRGKCRCSNPLLTRENAPTSSFVLWDSSDFVSTRTGRTKRRNEVVTRNGDSLFRWKRHRLGQRADVGEESIPPLLANEPGLLGHHVASSLDHELRSLLRCREVQLQPLDRMIRQAQAVAGPELPQGICVSPSAGWSGTGGGWWQVRRKGRTHGRHEAARHPRCQDNTA